MTVCYIPPATAAERIRFAIRAFIRTARMRWRRFRATFTPLGWTFIGAAGLGIVSGFFVAGFWL